MSRPEKVYHKTVTVMQPKGYRAIMRANLNKRYGNGITKTKKLTFDMNPES